jgi:hypothetical protein
MRVRAIKYACSTSLIANEIETEKPRARNSVHEVLERIPAPLKVKDGASLCRGATACCAEATGRALPALPPPTLGDYYP